MSKPPIEQAKEYFLKTCFPLVKPHHREILIPCYLRDYDDYKKALELPEVKQAIPSHIKKVRFQIVTKDGKPAPDMIIATAKDAASGRLERYLQSMGL